MWEAPRTMLFFYQNKPAALKNFFLGPVANYHQAWINMGPENLRAREPWEKIEFYETVNTWKMFPA